MTLDEILKRACPRCEHWDDGRLLGDPIICEEIWDYKCPCEIDVSECPTIRRWREHKAGP